MPADTAANKKRFLEKIAEGCTVGVAAQRCKISRATPYKWKTEDAEFAQAWDEAWDTCVDKVEHALIKSARRGNPSSQQFFLKYNRPERYGSHDEHRTQNNNGILQVHDQEHRRRLERLGLLIEMREGDYEEVDVDVSPRGNTEPPSGSDSSSG